MINDSVDNENDKHNIDNQNYKGNVDNDCDTDSVDNENYKVNVDNGNEKDNIENENDKYNVDKKNNSDDNFQTSLKRPPTSQLVKPSSVTSSRHCITGEEKIHISCVSECADDDKVLPAWWVCTKLPWPLFPTFEVLQTSNSSSSLSPIIMMTILFITAGEIRP